MSEIAEPKSTRQQLVRAALAAWNDYQATGLHMTEEEADTWLATLQAGAKANAPEPHI